MKKIGLLLGLLMGVYVVNAQTAVDFTADDCHGDEHNLFSELDEGKIVVLAWVMPCGPCVPAPLAALTIVNSYSESHPDRFRYYLVDDYANTTCETLSSWAYNNSFGFVTCFSTPEISMSDYGADGMPKIVLLAGQNYQVYFNENESIDGFQEAVDLALAENPVVVEELQKNDFTVYPNPVIDKLNIQTDFHFNKVSVMNVLGETVLNTDETLTQINTSEWNRGVYFVKLFFDNQVLTQRIILTNR